MKQARWWGCQMSGWHDPSHRFLVIWSLWERVQKGRPSREYRFYFMLSKTSLRVRIWNGKATFSNDWRSGRCCWYLSVPSLKSCRTGGALGIRNLASLIEPSLGFSKMELSCFHLFSSFIQERSEADSRLHENKSEPFSCRIVGICKCKVWY